jgi:hypothetical protein
MNIREVFKLVLTSVLLLSFASVLAQDSANDSADVWSVIEEQWNSDEKGDKRWPDRILTDDFAGWRIESPAPRSKSSIKMWNRFSDQLDQMVAHELYPLSIIVHDNVAVAHYLYSSAKQSKDGDIKMSNGRFTDVLVRTDDGWKFLTWHGGAD